MLWLAWPPASFTAPLLLLAFVPLLLAAEDIIVSERKNKGRKLFGIAFLTFFIWNTSCIYWVFNSLDSVMPAGVAALISLIPFGLAALLMTIAFWLYYRLRRITTRSWSYAGLIVFWIGYEFLHQTWDLAFPWMTLGNGFAESHRFVQWYEFTGVYGGSLWIWIANVLAFELFRATQAGILARKLAITLSLWILIPMSVSLFMYATFKEQENPANIVVVQPNVDPYLKYGSLPVTEQVKELIRLSDSAARPNTEYFIWPETAISEYVNEDQVRVNTHFIQIQGFLSKYKNGNVLSGIESYQAYDTPKTSTARYDERNGKYFDSFNAAIQIENSAKVQFYHKSKLVPGVEQTPFSSALSFLKPVFAAFGGSTGGYGFQAEPSVFYSQSGVGAAPVVCYESIWGEYVGEYVKKGAQFIAIVTNDGWWGNTAGKDQHMAYAKLRAIETRRWVARAANTGISGFINQRGDVVKQSKWWQPAALNADINLNEELTFYVKTGDYIAWLACFASAGFTAFLLYMELKRRKKS